MPTPWEHRSIRPWSYPTWTGLNRDRTSIRQRRSALFVAVVGRCTILFDGDHEIRISLPRTAASIPTAVRSSWPTPKGDGCGNQPAGRKNPAPVGEAARPKNADHVIFVQHRTILAD